MQARIQAARREAEGLKDKIKRKKDELADTSCMLLAPNPVSLFYSFPTLDAGLAHLKCDNILA